METHVVVVVGAGGVGKSSLTIKFLKNQFNHEYDPTIEDTYQKEVFVDGEKSLLQVIDTAGQEEYTSLREQHMDTGEGFLLVLSLETAESLNELEDIVASLFIRQRVPKKIGFQLAANKCDLPNPKVTPAMINYFLEKVSKRWAANISYLETSALTGKNVNECFENLVRQVRTAKSINSSAGKGNRDMPKSSKTTKDRKKCTIS